MKPFNKIFGVGMSKTGTTTLGRCYEILGVTPHIGFVPAYKKLLKKKDNIAPILQFAENYRSFEDNPWYHLYQDLDQRFPGSKFVLTVRKDSITHAKSAWAHKVARGQQHGEPTEAYLELTIRRYETHNQAVLDYFKGRPEDLLVACWERGDG